MSDEHKKDKPVDNGGIVPPFIGKKVEKLHEEEAKVLKSVEHHDKEVKHHHDKKMKVAHGFKAAAGDPVERKLVKREENRLVEVKDGHEFTTVTVHLIEKVDGKLVETKSVTVTDDEGNETTTTTKHLLRDEDGCHYDSEGRKTCPIHPQALISRGCDCPLCNCDKLGGKTARSV